MEAFVSGTETVANLAADLPPLEWYDDEPQFRLFVGGPSTAGKTVFLASLHKSLVVPGKNSTFFAKLTSEMHAHALFDRIDGIINPEAGWPEGDRIAKEYVFRCFHNAPSVQRKFPLFRFHYVDFPGRDLTKPGVAQMIDVQDEINFSHTVIFLLDGRKFLDGLENRPSRDSSIYQDLDRIAELANSCIYRPIQFVVTKWDILRDYKLKQVKGFLLRSDSFAAIVKARRAAQKSTNFIRSVRSATMPLMTTTAEKG